jgi:hypothetical protein
MTDTRLPLSAIARRGALLTIAWTTALFALAALLSILGAGAAIRDGIGDPGLDSDPEGLHTAIRILARNFPVAAIPIIAAYAVPRLPQWRAAADLFTTAAAALALLIGAGALAAFGTELVRYALAFGPIEIMGFALAIATYQTSRHRPPRSAAALARAAALVTAVLTMAAILEARLGGVI